MPSKVRIVVSGTPDGILTGRRALDWIQNHYATALSARLMNVAIPVQSTPRWLWLRRQVASFGPPVGTAIQFWRERRRLILPRSSYVTTLRACGIAKPLPPPVPGVVVPLFSRLYGLQGSQWSWRDRYFRLDLRDRATLEMGVIAGRDTVRLRNSMLVEVSAYIQRDRAFSGLAQAPTTPSSENSRFRAQTPSSRIGIWRG